MRLLLIGAQGLYNAEHFYMKAFRELGHEAALLDEYEGVRHRFLMRYLNTRTKLFRFTLDGLPINRRAVEEARRYDPDAVIIFKGELVSDRTIKELSGLFPTYLFYPDTYRFKPLLKGRLHMFRAVFTAARNAELYYRLGARRVVTVTWACDPSFHRRINTGKVYDVTFVGTWYPERTLSVLASRATVFGRFWPIPRARPPVFGEEYVATINRSRINLNVHARTDLKADAPNMRVFEVAGCGGFQVADAVPSLKQMFKDVPVYRGLKELRELIKYYLENEREREEIATKSQEACYRSYKYTDVARLIISSL